jgi:hypothetical protein
MKPGVVLTLASQSTERKHPFRMIRAKAGVTLMLWSQHAQAYFDTLRAV